MTVIHMLKESRAGDAKGDRPTVVGACGVEGYAPGMTGDGIRTSGWSTDVTCPACRILGRIPKRGT